MNWFSAFRAFLMAWLVLEQGLFAADAQAQTFIQLLSHSMQTHPTVQSKLSLVAVAAASSEAAQWAYYPTPSINVESVDGSSSDPSYSGDKQVTFVRLQQPLWTGGKLDAGNDKAKAGELYSYALLGEAKNQLCSKVITAYADWLVADSKMELLRKALLSYQGLRTQILRRIEEGASARSDLTLVEGRVQGGMSDLAYADVQRQVSVTRLSQLSGMVLAPEQLGRDRPVPAGAASSVSDLQLQALLNDPSLHLSAANLLTAEASLRERKSDLQPELYVRLEYQNGNFALKHQPDQTRAFVGMTSRFGAGLSVYSEERKAIAQLQAAQSDLDTQRQALQEQVASEALLYQSFSARIAALQRESMASEELINSYNRQYLAGRKTWIDVMNAQRESVQSQMQLNDAQVAQWSSAWRLALMTQGATQLAKATP
jgi:adhesin transport system outer membrane protein